MVEVFRTSRWVWSCPEKNQLLVSSSSGNRMRRNRLLAGIAWGLRFGFGLDTQTVAGTTPGYAFFPSNSPTIERQEPKPAGPDNKRLAVQSEFSNHNWTDDAPLALANCSDHRFRRVSGLYDYAQ